MFNKYPFDVELKSIPGPVDVNLNTLDMSTIGMKVTNTTRSINFKISGIAKYNDIVVSNSNMISINSNGEINANDYKHFFIYDENCGYPSKGEFIILPIGYYPIKWIINFK